MSTASPRWVTCREFIEFLMDYLSGEMPEAQRDEFDNHLSCCPSCIAYMKTYKQTIDIGKAALAPTDEPVPGEVPEDLVKAVLAARKKAR